MLHLLKRVCHVDSVGDARACNKIVTRVCTVDIRLTQTIASRITTIDCTCRLQVAHPVVFLCGAYIGIRRLNHGSLRCSIRIRDLSRDWCSWCYELRLVVIFLVEKERLHADLTLEPGLTSAQVISLCHRAGVNRLIAYLGFVALARRVLEIVEFWQVVD